MVCELHFYLVEVAQRVIEDGLLALALALTLTLLLLAHLLLLLLRRRLCWLTRSKRHEHARLHRLSSRPLRLVRLLHRPTGEDVAGSTGRTKWHLRLRLARIGKQAIRAVN